MMSEKDTPPEEMPPVGQQDNDPDNGPMVEPMESEISTLDIHQAVMREASDPHEAFDPGPRWFYALSVIALVVGGFYLGNHIGAFSTATHIGYLPPGVPRGAQVAAANAAANQVSGSTVYNGKCSSCHQPNGEGVPGAFPPLADSPYVINDPAIPVSIVLRGIQGPLEVKGVQYNGMMPAWAELLSDAEIAAVVSYIRNELGNNSADPVDEAFVAKVRQETSDRTTPWTAEELEGAKHE